MRLRLAASFALLASLSLACGLPEPCSEARPERDRQLSAYRVTLQAGLEHWRQEYETSESARAYGADSAAAGAIDRHVADLEMVDYLEERWAEGDEEGARDGLNALQNSFSAHHPEIDALVDAALAARHCTE